MTAGYDARGGLALDLDEVGRRFAVPEADRAGLRASYDVVRTDPALAGWVADAGSALRLAMGEPSPGPSLAARPPGPADVTSYLPVLSFAVALPDLLAHHEALGVPADVTALTLADVGRMLTRNRQWFGEPGLGDELAGWLTRHLHGALFQLGRLQFERVRLGEGTGLELRMAGFPCGPGDLALSLHIPQEGGPLTAEVVDRSLATARAFFRRRFARERYAVLVCHSWLLDPQLLDELPPTSNLAAFQRRFTVGGERGGEQEGDASVRRFVFADLQTPVGDLPTDSRLRRAVVERWRRGGHWHVRRGWIPWP